MALELNGTTGVSLVQDGVVTAADLASGAITSAALPTGSVLQVVQAVYATASQTGANVYNDTGLSASITPSSTSSKVLVMVNQPLSIKTDTADPRDIGFTIVRNSTLLTDGFGQVDTDTSSRIESSSGNYLIYLDSPNTTSSTTYKTQFKVNNGSCDVYAQQHGTESTITLMEIAG